MANGRKCSKCDTIIQTFHCTSPSCQWCENCGNTVRSELYERIIYGDFG